MHPLEKRNLLPADLKPVSSLKDYMDLGGLRGLEKARGMSPEALIALVKDSGLRGRGGAGFPTGVKWQTVYKDPAPRKFVVCNMAEGEPGTYKDRYLINKNPYPLIEGLLITAHAIGAEQAIIGTKKKFTKPVERIIRAIEEFEEAGLVPNGYIKLVLGPNDYLFGEEKALLEVIDGRGAMPRQYPPFMVGVHYSTREANPTVVNNAETMSHLPKIVVNGPEWFKSMGTSDTPGTMIITLCGDVKNPGMYEIELGITVRQLLYDIGGGPRGAKGFKAIFSGVSNRVMTPELFDTPMGFTSLREKGVGLGSGGFIAYDESRCMVRIAHMFSNFLAVSSCGQCVPCNTGCRNITERLVNLEFGKGHQSDLDGIRQEAGRCTNQTRCFLPTQESIVITSCMDKFPGEFAYHAGNECNYPEDDLVLPKIAFYNEETRQFEYEDPNNPHR